MGGNRIDNTDNNTVLIMAVLLGDLLILNLLYYAFLLNFGCEGGIASARQTMLMASVVYCSALPTTVWCSIKSMLRASR